MAKGKNLILIHINSYTMKNKTFLVVFEENIKILKKIIAKKRNKNVKKYDSITK